MITEEICRRIMAAAFPVPGTMTHGTSMHWQHVLHNADFVLVSPPQSLDNSSSVGDEEEEEEEPEEDAEFKRSLQDLNNRVKIKLSSPPQPVRCVRVFFLSAALLTSSSSSSSSYYNDFPKRNY